MYTITPVRVMYSTFMTLSFFSSVSVAAVAVVVCGSTGKQMAQACKQEGPRVNRRRGPRVLRGGGGGEDRGRVS